MSDPNLWINTPLGVLTVVTSFVYLFVALIWFMVNAGMAYGGALRERGHYARLAWIGFIWPGFLVWWLVVHVRELVECTREDES